MNTFLIIICILCIIGLIIGLATVSDDSAFWQWRLYGLIAAVIALMGLRLIHNYGFMHGYW